MISLGIFLLGVIVTIFLIVKNRGKLYKIVTDKWNGQKEVFNPAALTLPILTFIVFSLVALFQPFAIDRVDAGHVGVKVNLTGHDRGVSDIKYATGWVTYNTWTEQLYEFPTFQQHIDYDKQTVILKGGFTAVIKPTFNYALKAVAVTDMFAQLRLGIREIEQGWLKNAIIGSVNDVANRWKVEDIFEKREDFENAIVLECNKRVQKWFDVSQLRTNIAPPEALRNAIEAKTKAVQEAQAKVQEALVADANAKKLIATAKGDSAQAVITASGKAQAAIIAAKGEAEAMRLKQRELTSTYVEYIKAQQWNGVMPTTILGNSGALINLK